MNDLEIMQRFLSGVFPYNLYSLDRPLFADGVWSMDIFRDGKHMNVCWKAGKGFGLAYSEDRVYGEGADEVFDSLWPAMLRVLELLGEKKWTL